MLSYEEAHYILLRRRRRRRRMENSFLRVSPPNDESQLTRKRELGRRRRRRKKKPAEIKVSGSLYLLPLLLLLLLLLLSLTWRVSGWSWDKVSLLPPLSTCWHQFFFPQFGILYMELGGFLKKLFSVLHVAFFKIPKMISRSSAASKMRPQQNPSDFLFFFYYLLENMERNHQRW